MNSFISVVNITLPDQCRVSWIFKWTQCTDSFGCICKSQLWFQSQASDGCLQNLLEQIENITAQVLPVTVSLEEKYDKISRSYLDSDWHSSAVLLVFVDISMNSNSIYLINELDCDEHFDCGLQRFREDFRVIIISKPNWTSLLWKPHVKDQWETHFYISEADRHKW